MYSQQKYESNVRLDDSDCTFLEYQDAYVLPCRFNPKREWGDGGILDKNKNFIAESGFYGWTDFGGSYEIHSFDKLDENVIWFGNFMNHWGHFLYDHISRMWYVLNNYNDEYIVYVGNKMEGSFLEFLSLLGVNPKKIIYVDKPIQVKNIIIPEYSYNYKNKTYKKEFIQIFDRVVSEALSNFSMNIEKNIYLSRKNFKFALQKEFGEKYIEEAFTLNQYASLYPESMTLREQIYVWNMSTNVVCVNGTLPLNLCFAGSNKGLKLIVLNKTKILHDSLYDFQKIFGINVDYIDVFDKKINLSKNIGAGPFVMEVNENVELLFKHKNYIIPKKSYFQIGKYGFIVRFYFMRLLKDNIKRILPRKVVSIVQEYRLNKAYNSKQT